MQEHKRVACDLHKFQLQNIESGRELNCDRKDACFEEFRTNFVKCDVIIAWITCVLTPVGIFVLLETIPFSLNEAFACYVKL